MTCEACFIKGKKNRRIVATVIKADTLLSVQICSDLRTAAHGRSQTAGVIKPCMTHMQNSKYDSTSGCHSLIYYSCMLYIIFYFWVNLML